MTDLTSREQQAWNAGRKHGRAERAIESEAWQAGVMIAAERTLKRAREAPIAVAESLRLFAADLMELAGPPASAPEVAESLRRAAEREAGVTAERERWRAVVDAAIAKHWGLATKPTAESLRQRVKHHQADCWQRILLDILEAMEQRA